MGTQAEEGQVRVSRGRSHQQELSPLELQSGSQEGAGAPPWWQAGGGVYRHPRVHRGSMAGSNTFAPQRSLSESRSSFLIDFGQQKSSIFFAFFQSSGDDREKAVKDVVETLKMIEDRGLGDKKFFGGNTHSLVDLRFGWLVYWFESMEEVVGLQVVEPSTLPRLHQWTLNFKQEPVIKENLPDKAALLEHYKEIREARLSSLA